MGKHGFIIPYTMEYNNDSFFAHAEIFIMAVVFATYSYGSDDSYLYPIWKTQQKNKKQKIKKEPSGSFFVLNSSKKIFSFISI